MEKENQEEKVPRMKRRVSLFRRRKKPQIRHVVRDHKSRNYGLLIANIIIIALGIFILITLLYIVRTVLLPQFVGNNAVILTPQGNFFPDNNQVKNIIQNTGLETDSITFSPDLITVTFNFHKNTFVLLSLKKDIRGQIDLVEAIDAQMKQDGKQAIYIDLRYNKPIVKF